MQPTRASSALICMSGRGDKDMPTLQRTLLAGVRAPRGHAGASREAACIA
jgi:hypothetical protein